MDACVAAVATEGEILAEFEEEAGVEEPSEEEKAALLREFIAKTSSDEATAQSFLEAHEYVLENATADYLSQVEDHDADHETVEEAETFDADESSANDGTKEGNAPVPAEPVSKVEEANVNERQRLADMRNAPQSGELIDLEKLVWNQHTDVGVELAAAIESYANVQVEGSELAGKTRLGEDIGDEQLQTISLAPGHEISETPLEPVQPPLPSDTRLPTSSEREFETVDEVAQRIGKEVAELATEAGREAREAISGIGHKVLGGWGSWAANSSSEGGPVLKDIGSKLSNWWANLDPASEGSSRLKSNGSTSVGSGSQSMARTAEEIRRLFSAVDSHENLIKAFPCMLTQTYRCAHNSYTPDIQMAFQGTLYILDKHTCFNAEERGRSLPIILEHPQIVEVTRQKLARKGNNSEVLVLRLSDTEWLGLKDFEPGSLDDAHGLLEHLCFPPANAAQ